MAVQGGDQYTEIAQDLATWINQTAHEVALGMMPQGRAPFSAPLSEQQKLDYYTQQLFNADGTPNMQGRQAQLQRLGPENFANVFKAVIKAHPELKVPSPPEGAAIPPPTIEQMAAAGPAAPMPMPGPPMGGGLGPGMGRMPAVLPGAAPGTLTPGGPVPVAPARYPQGPLTPAG